jgi:hypothetical protein
MSMDQQTLQLFSRQLAHWAESAIHQGRFPFRKVETFPSLLTEHGELHPALVFWINRASCMAGGILVLPPQNAEQGVEAGRTCARALGVRHFVTWAPREIVFWEDRGEAAARGKTITLPNSSDAAAGFRKTLTAVMEELKILSVIGAVPPAQLSAHYLANLCRETLLAARTGLTETFRVARGENRLAERAPTPETLALRKGMLTLLRLIGLTAYDRLPPTVQPEGLERAMRFALDTLTEDSRKTLSMAEDELPLPVEEAVIFHHLFRRLVQLRPGDDRPRLARSLEILLAHEAGGLGGSPLPFTEAEAEAGGRALLVNPDGFYRRGEGTIEVAPAPILAFSSLLQDLQDLGAPRERTEEVLALTSGLAPAVIDGTLNGDDIPQAREHRSLAAQLRTSWPTRRFPLPARTPRWVWEFLHLLGLAGEGARIGLNLPDTWLTADFGATLTELLKEQFTLTYLAAGAEGRLQLRLTKEAAPEGMTTLIGPGEPRHLSWGSIRAGHRSLLPLSLHLSDELFSLLEGGFLHIPNEADWPAVNERELFLFTRSSLGRLLWGIVSGGRPLPSRQLLRDEALRRGLPLPAPEILENLRLLCREEAHALPAQGDIDRELALWLGAGVDLSGQGARPPSSRPAPRPAQQPDNADLAGQIARAVFVDGLPRFPEQYLYDYYRPQLVEYRFSGPLVVDSEFFDRITLQDRQGALLEVEGAETAQALLLASFGERSSVALPADRQLTATILDRYRNDLKALRRALVQHAHSRLAGSRAADTLAETIWRSFPLPPGELVDD